MKKIISILISISLVSCFLTASKKVYVHSYTKKNGTVVSAHSYIRKNGTTVSTHYRNYSGTSHYSLRSYDPPRLYHSPRSHLSYPTTATRNNNGRLKRSEAAKREFMRLTGYPHGRTGYVIDHIIPLKKGGCDCPSNMQWQTIFDGKQKDKWE